METLVVVAQHRNQYYSQVTSHGVARLGSPLPSRDFRGANCRSFESTGPGILPFPYKGYTTPVSKQPCSSPTTPSSAFETHTSQDRAGTRSALIAGDDGRSERLFTLTKESPGCAVSIDEISVDCSGRSFLVKTPDAQPFSSGAPL